MAIYDLISKISVGNQDKMQIIIGEVDYEEKKVNISDELFDFDDVFFCQVALSYYIPDVLMKIFALCIRVGGEIIVFDKIGE